jgi:hypothetical protein
MYEHAVEQTEAMLRRYRDFAERAAEAQREWAQSQTTASTQDRKIAVTVGSSGQLVDLKLHQDVFRGRSAQSVAAEILRLAGEASARGGTASAASLQSLWGPDTAGFRTGAYDADTTLRSMAEQLR